ncbi:hypothetical protein EI200_21170 [Peribacillus simplex]|nr:hypothetical protein EI200_21170 [Peribacillus simplex]
MIFLAFSNNKQIKWLLTRWKDITSNRVIQKMTIFCKKVNPGVSYWIGKQYWGKGIATGLNFLTKINVRPLYARAVKENL